jgi:hypothetical protein
MWHKRWQNARPGWTRRITWYIVPNTDGQRIHLRFDERLPNNDGRERWDVIVSKSQAEELWNEYQGEDTREARDIFVDVMADQENDG